MPHALYLIGEPAVGKSSLMMRLTSCFHWASLVTKPFAHRFYYRAEAGAPSAIEFGGDHPDFPGTDRLSMSVQPLAILYASSLSTAAPQALLLGEGDRLATRPFLSALAEDYDVTVVALTAAPEVADERRAVRGTSQNPSWVAGRRTKVAGLAEWWGKEHRLIEVDTSYAGGAEVAETVLAALPLEVGRLLNNSE